MVVRVVVHGGRTGAGSSVLVVYAPSELGAAVRAAVRLRPAECAALGVLLSCLGAADDLSELRLLGFVSVGVVASAGVVSLLLLSVEEATVRAVPVDDRGRELSLRASGPDADRVRHLRVLQAAAGGTVLGTLTA